jgi:hypothetical protein
MNRVLARCLAPPSPCSRRQQPQETSAEPAAQGTAPDRRRGARAPRDQEEGRPGARDARARREEGQAGAGQVARRLPDRAERPLPALHQRPTTTVKRFAEFAREPVLVRQEAVPVRRTSTTSSSATSSRTTRSTSASACRITGWTEQQARGTAGHASGAYYATYYQSPTADTVIARGDAPDRARVPQGGGRRLRGSRKAWRSRCRRRSAAPTRRPRPVPA